MVCNYKLSVVVKKVTRRVLFKNKKPAADESTFEKDLCEQLVKKIPDIQACDGKTNADRVEQYLMEDLRARKIVVLREAFKYINEEQITHYINEIELGASTFIVTDVEGDSVGVDIGGDIEALSAAGAKANFKMAIEKIRGFTKHQKVGDIETVEPGKGERVNDYYILQVDTLFHRYQKLRKVIRNAVKMFLEKDREFIAVRLHTLQRLIPTFTIAFAIAS